MLTVEKKNEERLHSTQERKESSKGGAGPEA